MIEYVNLLLLLTMFGSTCYVYYRLKKIFYLISIVMDSEILDQLTDLGRDVDSEFPKPKRGRKKKADPKMNELEDNDVRDKRERLIACVLSGNSKMYLSTSKYLRRFNLSYRYIDDIISFNNKRFKEFISDIYPKELTISETTESTSVASYLDLLFTRDRSNNITTKLYDKRDAFGFHIVNFPFMSSNIPSAPAYGVYASQLVRYAHCCSNYSDF